MAPYKVSIYSYSHNERPSYVPVAVARRAIHLLCVVYLRSEGFIIGDQKFMHGTSAPACAQRRSTWLAEICASTI